MKTLIVYMSMHGCTEKVALTLQKKAEDEVILINLKNDLVPSLSGFDRIVIGGSIHAGQIQKRIRTFCQDHQEFLLNKELGLFICCMEEGDKAREQFRNAYPESLRWHAKTSAIMGGEFNLDQMNFLERWMVQKVAHVSESVSRLNYKSMDVFMARMEHQFNPFLYIA